MTSIKTSFIAFFAVLLLASGVRGQTSLTLTACDDGGDGTTDFGKSLTTYEILCDKKNDGSDLATIATKNGASFGTLCSLLDKTLTTSDGQVVDLRGYLLDTTRLHTIFAPTDAAFANIQTTVNEVTALETTNPTAFANIVAGWLQLHILEQTYLDTDFTCEETYETQNLSNSPLFNQRQKTKCRATAAYFDQIGVGNIGNNDQPTVGKIEDVFLLSQFAIPTTVLKKTVDGTGFSSNVIGCNGVIHVVDEVLLPSDYGNFYYGSKGTKGGWGKSYKYGKYYGRSLIEEGVIGFDGVDVEDRRARLEALVIDADGNTEPVE